MAGKPALRRKTSRMTSHRVFPKRDMSQANVCANGVQLANSGMSEHDHSPCVECVEHPVARANLEEEWHHRPDCRFAWDYPCRRPRRPRLRRLGTRIPLIPFPTAEGPRRARHNYHINAIFHGTYQRRRVAVFPVTTESCE